MKNRDLFVAFSYVEDRYLDIVDSQEKESFEMQFEKKHPLRRKSLTFLVAVIICISILATTALAAGWIPGIFSAMKEEAPENEALFSAAAEANTDSVAEVREIPQLDLTKFTLFEKYYDGETILLGYDLSSVIPEPLVGYVPQDNNWENIKSGNTFADVIPQEITDWKNSPAFHNAVANTIPEECKNMALSLYEMLTPDEYAKAMELLQKDGYVCVMTHELWVGDHILINGHEIAEVLSEEIWNMRYDYEVEEGSCVKITPLPEAGIDQENVTVTLNIRSCERYWYMDLEGNATTSTGGHETTAIDFLLDNVNK